MFDYFLYAINQFIFGHGTDRTFILVFSLVFLLMVFVWLCFTFIHVMQAAVLFVTLSFLSFFPVFCFPDQFDAVLIKLGIISEWFIYHSPQYIRVWTVWMFLISLITTLFFCWNLTLDIFSGRPSTWKRKWMNLQKRADELDRMPFKIVH
ncbi:hypothetical protein B1A99_25160 [Cohnella sp. CIP 111063]|nr:hypothetical protein B1A99_25160 [Cohnella sp. CIP 111063]